MALLISAFALMPAASWAQPAPQIAAPKQAAAPETSNSTLDIPIEDIAASLSGRAILDKDFPGLCTHSMYGVFKVMTLNQIAALSHGKITSDMLAQAQTDLSAYSFKPVVQSVRQTDVEDMNPAPSGSQASLGDSYPK
jgi:hypothetical protein